MYTGTHALNWTSDTGGIRVSGGSAEQREAAEAKGRGYGPGRDADEGRSQV